MSIFSQLNFKFGAAKLNSNNANELALVGNDGGEILVYSPITSDFISCALNPGGLVQNLFNNTCYIMGVANQTAAANTLYSVYLRNLDGTENGCVMDLWPTLSGYNPDLNNSNMYIKTINDVPLIYLGQVWTGSSDISTIISPATDLRQPCYSHFNPWNFGFQSTVVQSSPFTQGMSGVQSSPSILTVTEGISECPSFHASLNFYGNDPATVGGFVEFYIQVSGQCIDGAGGGTTWTSNSPTQYLTVKNHSTFYQMTAEWMSAPPIGVYTAKLVVNYTGSGSLLYRSQMLGRLSL